MKSVLGLSQAELRQRNDELRKKEDEYLKKKKANVQPDRRSEETKERAKEFVQNLRQEETIIRTQGTLNRKLYAALVRPEKDMFQVMEYETAKKIFWRACQVRMQQMGKNFIVDDHNRGFIQELVKYMIGDQTCELDLKKGLCLVGPVGIGKTMLLQVAMIFARAAKIESRQFFFHQCTDLHDEVQDKEKTSCLQRYYQGDRCFDDLGDEPISLKHYGNEIIVMSRVLTERYKNFVNGKCITHITTNLLPEEIEDRYGTRIFDRFNEMFNWVFLDGPSKRK